MNEIMDTSAEEAACLNFVGHEPAVGFPATVTSTCEKQCAVKKQLKHWRTIDDVARLNYSYMHQTKKLIHLHLG